MFKLDKTVVAECLLSPFNFSVSSLSFTVLQQHTHTHRHINFKIARRVRIRTQKFEGDTGNNNLTGPLLLISFLSQVNKYFLPSVINSILHSHD